MSPARCLYKGLKQLFQLARSNPWAGILDLEQQAQIVMGADFPYTAPDPVGFIAGAPCLNKVEKEAVLWKNAAKLLRLSL